MMDRRFSRIVILAGCLSFLATTAFAQEKSETKSAPLADMKPELTQYVRVIEAFGTGNIDAALDLVEAALPRPFHQPNEPLEGGARDNWRQQFQVFGKIKPKFDSVDVIGYREVSSASRTLTMIGHGEYGPVLFSFRVFRYQDKWKIHGVSFQASWEHIEEADNFTRLETPLQFPLANLSVAQKVD